MISRVVPGIVITSLTVPIHCTRYHKPTVTKYIFDTRYCVIFFVALTELQQHLDDKLQGHGWTGCKNGQHLSAESKYDVKLDKASHGHVRDIKRCVFQSTLQCCVKKTTHKSVVIFSWMQFILHCCTSSRTGKKRFYYISLVKKRGSLISERGSHQVNNGDKEILSIIISRHPLTRLVSGYYSTTSLWTGTHTFSRHVYPSQNLDHRLETATSNGKQKESKLLVSS